MASESAFESEFVAVRRHEGGVAELVLDRPKAMNAVSTAMARAIGAACAELAADRTVRVVVLSSTSERAFCVGADLKERNSFSDAELVRQRPTTRGAYGGVAALPMPTIAAVHGFALGGGFELALACDVIVADETSVVGLPEVSVGVIPGGGGTQLLPRRVGAARAAELIFTARRVEAAEALSLGLVDSVVPAGQDTAEALALAARMAANSPWVCGRPSGRCGWATGWTWRPVWRSRTRPGGRWPSRVTGWRASRRSTRSASRTGRGVTVRSVVASRPHRRAVDHPW